MVAVTILDKPGVVPDEGRSWGFLCFVHLLAIVLEE